MNKTTISFFLCAFAKCIFGQDTIFLKTNSQLLVRVLEVSETEVRYKNFYNPDGIIRVLNFNEINEITYENGIKESRFLNPIGKTTAKQPFFVIEGNHISLPKKDLTHKEAFAIMLKKDPKLNSDQLNNALVTAEGKKTGQIACTIASPIFLVGGFYIAKRNYYGPNDLPKFKTILLTGVGLATTSFIIAQIYKAQKNKNIRKAAKLYNEEL